MMFKKSKLFEAAKKMPPLRHSFSDRDFDIRDSEVVKWLVSNPITMRHLFNAVKQSGAIVYDKTAGTWRGINYEAES